MTLCVDRLTEILFALGAIDDYFVQIAIVDGHVRWERFVG